MPHHSMGKTFGNIDVSILFSIVFYYPQTCWLPYLRYIWGQHWAVCLKTRPILELESWLSSMRTQGTDNNTTVFSFFLPWWLIQTLALKKLWKQSHFQFIIIVWQILWQNIWFVINLITWPLGYRPEILYTCTDLTTSTTMVPSSYKIELHLTLHTHYSILIRDPEGSNFTQPPIFRARSSRWSI